MMPAAPADRLALFSNPRVPGLWMPCFVREVTGRQQAPSGGSLFEPSDHADAHMHHNSWHSRMARIIVPVAAARIRRPGQQAIGFRYRSIGNVPLSVAAERLLS
jgi:hypothetical protein